MGMSPPRTDEHARNPSLPLSLGHTQGHTQPHRQSSSPLCDPAREKAIMHACTRSRPGALVEELREIRACANSSRRHITAGVGGQRVSHVYGGDAAVPRSSPTHTHRNTNERGRNALGGKKRTSTHGGKNSKHPAREGRGSCDSLLQ